MEAVFFMLTFPSDLLESVFCSCLKISSFFQLPVRSAPSKYFASTRSVRVARLQRCEEQVGLPDGRAAAHDDGERPIRTQGRRRGDQASARPQGCGQAVRAVEAKGWARQQGQRTSKEAGREKNRQKEAAQDWLMTIMKGSGVELHERRGSE
eukprot:6213365-Pleurochrysis_carterae.AAC.3